MKKLCTIFALCWALLGVAQNIVVNDEVAYGLAEVSYCEVEWNGDAAVGVFYFTDGSSVLVEDLRTISFGGDVLALNNAQDNMLRVYPNPTIDYVTIENASAGEVRIFDLSGALVLRETISAGTATVQTNQLSQGTYLIQLNNKIFKLNKK